jgi:hypothetical protein
MAQNGKVSLGNGSNGAVIKQAGALSCGYPAIGREQFFAETKSFLSGRALKLVRRHADP